MKVLLASTPVGAIGSGAGGGVEQTVANIQRALTARGHQAEVVAPSGSVLRGARVHEVSGAFQHLAQNERRTSVSMPYDSTLAAMWDEVRKLQHNFDVALNFAYDWLPFYLTDFLSIPVGHFVTMGSLNEGMNSVVRRAAARSRNAVAMCSTVQADTFGLANQCAIVGHGLNLDEYAFCDEPGDAFFWAARIAPEKGLEDALEAASSLGVKLKIAGSIQDAAYWEKLQRSTHFSCAEYLGFLSTEAFQNAIRSCRAMLMTPRWVEALGIVGLEALACGVPVVAYARGGPIEIVRDGETGYLVEPDSVSQLSAAMSKVAKLNRTHCRRDAEERFSLEAFGERVERWAEGIIKERQESAGARPSLRRRESEGV